MRRPCLIPMLVLLSWLIAPTRAAAQLGAIKKKATEQLPGQQPKPTGVKPAPKCDASTIVITTDVADRYLKSLAAGDAELAKLAKEPGEVGHYYTVYNQRQVIQRQKEDHRLHRRPAWESYHQRRKAIYQRLMKGDMKAQAELEALEQEVNPTLPSLPENAWESTRQGNARMDSVMLKAGGFSECDWKRIAGDPPTISYIVSNLVSNRAAAADNLKGVATAAEIKAVDPRLPELARALGYDYETAADRAQLAADSVMLEKEAKQPVLTGDPMTDCVNKASAEFMEKHKAEFEAASKKSDQTELMRLAQLQSKEAAKCSKAASDDDDD